MNTSVIVGLLLFLVGVWVYRRLPRWRTARARARREPLPEAQSGERLFPTDLSLIAARLRRMASDQLGKDLSQLQPNDRLAPVLSDGFDSLDSVELVMAIEEEFGIELDDASVSKIETFYDLVTAVAAQRPFLPKWRRRLGRAIEQHLGLSLPRETLAMLATPLALTEAVAKELKFQAGAQQSCQNQRAFYLLRNALRRTLHLPRRAITPSTALSALIPWRAARSVWPQLRGALAARNWPELVRPGWMRGLVCGLPLLGGTAAVLGLPLLADWVSRRDGDLGSTLYLISELRLWFVIPLVIVSWALLVRVSKRLSCGIPPGIHTVADLVPFVVTSAHMTWTREQIEQMAREIVVTELPVPAGRYQASERFVEASGLEVRSEKL